VTTVAVLGAINVDLVISGAPLPRPGETVTGGAFAQHHGGKGGNQATAAARALGEAGHVAMIGAVGDDALGAEAREVLASDGVDTTHLLTRDATPTGVALITVDPDGENQISVAPGANDALGSDHVAAALGAVGPSVLLVSLEVPRLAALAAATWCRGHDVPLLVNPAPLRPWAVEVIEDAAWITPNEHELAALDPVPARPVVVETRGPEGATIHGDAPVRIPAPPVDAVDTTGAGDCFNGVLAASLAEGLDITASVHRAVTAATMSVVSRGARTGMPKREQIPAETGTPGLTRDP
jgi:ribokinase